MTIGPIKPSDIAHKKTEELPEVVFKIVNRLIALHWRGQMTTLKAKDIVAAFKANAEEVYDPVWLDFEDCYRAVGWKVAFHAPAYDESYDPYYEFTKNTLS